MQVHLLTIEQKDLMIGQLYAPDSYFNAVQDANDNWVTSVIEVDLCVNPDYLWVKELPLIEFAPKIVELL